MRYYTTIGTFSLAAAFIAIINLLIFPPLSVHVLFKILMDIIFMAIALLFPKRRYAILLFIFFMLREVYGWEPSLGVFRLLMFIFAGIAMLPVLIGYFVAYVKK